MHIFISIYKIIKSVNNLKDKIIRTLDNISLYFVKRTFYSTICLISLFLNCSHAISFVPKQWKISYVKPIHKKGSLYNPSKYIPISLTDHMCRQNL